jgi:hypothetical protein
MLEHPLAWILRKKMAPNKRLFIKRGQIGAAVRPLRREALLLVLELSAVQ